MICLNDLSGEVKADFLDDVLSIVANGSDCGVTISDLMDCLRHGDAGARFRWRLPVMAEVRNYVEGNGFTVTRGRQRGGGYETRITV